MHTNQFVSSVSAQLTTLHYISHYFLTFCSTVSLLSLCRVLSSPKLADVGNFYHLNQISKWFFFLKMSANLPFCDNQWIWADFHPSSVQLDLFPLNLFIFLLSPFPKCVSFFSDPFEKLFLYQEFYFFITALWFLLWHILHIFCTSKTVKYTYDSHFFMLCISLWLTWLTSEHVDSLRLFLFWIITMLSLSYLPKFPVVGF